MTVDAQFRAALDQAEPAPVELLPDRLARTCVDVLADVDGAGLSIFATDLRVPLGASDTDATFAERLQFTLDEGPCLLAVRQGSPVRAPQPVLHQQWPDLYAELATRTPYRSVASVPFRFAPDAAGALDLYSVQADAAAAIDLTAATEITGTMVAVLNTANAPSPELLHPGPLWLRGPVASRRMDVWIAIGLLNARLHVATTDALALIRAYAYTKSQLVDDVAAALITGTLPVDQFQP